MENQIFVSHSGRNAFEASILQYVLETMLANEGVTAWTFQGISLGPNKKLREA